MSQTKALAERIYALAERQGLEPSTMSRKLLGNGSRLAEIANGGSMTMDVFARVEREVSRLESA